MLAMDLLLWWSLEFELSAFKNPSRKCLFLWTWPAHRWPYLNRPFQIEKTTELNGFKYVFYCDLSIWVEVALLHRFFSVSPLVDLITLEWVINFNTVQIMAEWANICKAFYPILSSKVECDHKLWFTTHTINVFACGKVNEWRRNESIKIILSDGSRIGRIAFNIISFYSCISICLFHLQKSRSFDINMELGQVGDESNGML